MCFAALATRLIERIGTEVEFLQSCAAAMGSGKVKPVAIKLARENSRDKSSRAQT
jgi:hypothetical protein